MASRPLRSSSRTKPPSQPQPVAARPSRTAVGRTTPAPAPQPAPTATKALAKTSAVPRRPLVTRDNSSEFAAEAAKFMAPPPPANARSGSAKPPSSVATEEREPIKAYLRIRPHLGDDDPSSAPYLESLSDTAVRMTDPGTGDAARARLRQSLAATSADYTFSHVFPPLTAQAEFFTKTTLPLVRDLLVQGRNGLLFAYGVTNSGKTYTVQGGAQEGSAGILPRTLDVIFNSIEGMQSDGNFRPVRLHGVEPNDRTSEANATLAQMRTEPALASVLDELSADGYATPASGADVDPTVVSLDRNHEYSLWLSYAEVYNEKVYDLLAPSSGGSSGGDMGGGPSRIPRTTAAGAALLLSRRALTVRPSPPGDASDPDAASGKYIAGLRQVRVRSAAEAKALVRLGQLHRRVFGTLANSQSSRSHGLVTLKLLRQHRGEKNDPAAIQSARLTLVDLAGSERTKHTQTSGERLKEAGSINKSLMVLGQCLETLRANQRRVAQTLAAAGRSDTRDARRALQVVPFRHSKLTEVLMDYFVGDGRVAMIVNVNPYDTGFEENSHVMRFAAIAREVSTVALPTAARPSSQPHKPTAGKGRGTIGKGEPPVVQRRSVTLSMGGGGRVVSQTHLEVLEEDEEVGEEDGEEPVDIMIEALFEEIDDLRMELFESEMRCALVEAETREEVMSEMEERMRHMETMFRKRLANEMEQQERKTNAKIEMLHRSGMFGQAPSLQPSRVDSDVEMDGDETEEYEEELDIEKSLCQDDYLNDIPEDNAEEVEPSRSPSPLSGKDKGKAAVHDVPMLDLEPVDDSGNDDLTDGEPVADESEDEYVPPPPPVTKTKARTSKAQLKPSARVSHVTVDDVNNGNDDAGDDSVLIIPNKKARQAAIAGLGPDAEYIPRPGEVDTIKKKKRQLGKKPVMTGDQIERIVEQHAREPEKGKTVRRMTRRAAS